MTSRTLLTLTIAALIAIGAGVWLATRQSSSSAGAERALLYPELKQQLDAVQSVRIFKAGDKPAVEIVRKGSDWVVAERDGYPADESKLGKFLRGLAEAKVVEEKTSNPENYTSLGVEDVKDPNAAGARVELGGAPAAVTLIVGKAGPGGQSHYVRRAGEQQSWLVAANIDTSASPDAWLRKDILDVSADRIQSASVTVEKQKPYTAAKTARADANFAIAELPKGKKLSSPSVANGFATALAGLTLADVQPASAFEAAPPAAHATFTTFDGLVVKLDGWTREDKRFIAVQTSHDPNHAERFEKQIAPPVDDKVGDKSDAKAAEPKTPTTDEKKPNVEEEAQTIGARVDGWVYEIPSYKYEQIFKPVEDLVAS